jgi:hypothetical protein
MVGGPRARWPLCPRRCAPCTSHPQHVHVEHPGVRKGHSAGLRARLLWPVYGRHGSDPSPGMNPAGCRCWASVSSDSRPVPLWHCARFPPSFPTSTPSLRCARSRESGRSRASANGSRAEHRRDRTWGRRHETPRPPNASQRTAEPAPSGRLLQPPSREGQGGQERLRGYGQRRRDRAQRIRLEVLPHRARGPSRHAADRLGPGFGPYRRGGRDDQGPGDHPAPWSRRRSVWMECASDARTPQRSGGHSEPGPAK